MNLPENAFFYGLPFLRKLVVLHDTIKQQIFIVIKPSDVWSTHNTLFLHKLQQI